MFLAVDELDLFLLFQSRGLFVEPDPNRLAQIFPGTGPPSVAAQRRYARQQPKMIPGRTRPLDAWYASVLAPGQTVRRQAASNGSGGQCCSPLLPAETRLARLVGERMGVRPLTCASMRATTYGRAARS